MPKHPHHPPRRAAPTRVRRSRSTPQPDAAAPAIARPQPINAVFERFCRPRPQDTTYQQLDAQLRAHAAPSVLDGMLALLERYRREMQQAEAEAAARWKAYYARLAHREEDDDTV